MPTPALLLRTEHELQVLQGHMQVALADAQSITVLRAIQKGNAPSLVAALACDTAAMYQAAAQAFNHPSCSSHGSKACRYAEWKLLIFQGYMYAFTGLFIYPPPLPQPPFPTALLHAPFMQLSTLQQQSVHSVSWVSPSQTAVPAAAVDPLPSISCVSRVQCTVGLLDSLPVIVCILQQCNLACNHRLFAGLHHLKSHEGGKAVQCAGEATSLCQAAVKAAAAFDKAAPASVPVDHVHFDVTFGDCSASVYAKVRWSTHV